MNAERILQAMIDLARAHPGQPVSIVAYPDGEVVGVMNIYPDHEDWFYYPVPLEDVQVDQQKPLESIA